MGIKIYMNGKWVDKEEAKISVFDHGLLYGDGVFEGIRSYDCLVFKLKEHIDRLYESAHTLMLEIPLRKEEMEQAVLETLKANRLRDAYIRVVVTRGEGDLGLDPRKCKKPNIFIIADKIVLYPEKYYREGLEIITVPTQRNIPEALNPQIKSLNYLNNILAKIEAINCGVEEAIMLNSFGYVAECTGDNIFMIKNRLIITPPPYAGILKGITRAAVMELAEKAGFEVKETIFTRHELYNADECFLTGTAAEIIPVVKIDSRVIGEGKPGEITLSLMRKFKELTKSAGVRYSL
ncbi:MAG: branched-chain-amino-acid transaminase [Candidatus Omnitrophica bacterium]|nr:branched-chain-amino-acid transaminase [Candidatus Omnitrophota bacterium]MCM8798175.1 branched-chain-amino-acid transaminase [Candidatus Omnitrophota bacterium]